MSKSISIREYDLLSKDERHKFVENGGVVVGDPLPKSIPRSEFNRLNQTDRRKFFSAGGINGHRVPPDASDSTSASDGYAWKLPPP
jgi:hypothetical protein